MAVAVIDTGTAAYNASALNQDFTFTVSSGSTLAVFYIVQDVSQTITSVTWDNGGTNQACTLVSSQTCANGKVYIYAVVSPTVGASKTLRVVNGTATGVSCELQSYSGTVISSVAAAANNPLGATGSTTGNVGTAAQSGANGDMYVSAYLSNGTLGSPFNGNQIYVLAPTGNDACGNRFASTGASVALTATAGGGTWAAASCNIVAAPTDTLAAQIWI